MKRNSILFLTNAYPDFTSSYRGNFVKNMAGQLQKRGYKISVVTPKIYKGSHYVEEQEGMKVFRFPFLAGNRLLIEYERIPYLKMLIYHLSGLIVTLYVLLKYRCELIHVHWAIPTGVIGVVAAVLLRKPLVVTIHGSDFRMAIEGHSLLRRVFLHVCKKSRHITCVSEVQRKGLEGLGIEGQRISVFPMCIEEDFLEAGRRRKELGNRSFTILSNRNHLPIYNVSMLIRAIPIVLEQEPDTKFLIAGNGSERDRLEQEAKRLNVDSSTQFLGRIPHEEMANLLTQADIYVSTSLYDGTSVSLLEAMASGAFPVVTDIPPNREWISDGENGFLIPTGDETILGRRMVEVIRDTKLLAEASKKNRKIVEEKVDWGRNIGKIAEIYEESP